MGQWLPRPPSHALGIIIAPVSVRYPAKMWLNSVCNKHGTAKYEQCVLFLGWNVFFRHTTEVIKTRPPSRLSGKHATITELPARDTITSTDHSSNLVSINFCPRDFLIASYQWSRSLQPKLRDLFLYYFHSFQSKMNHIVSKVCTWDNSTAVIVCRKYFWWSSIWYSTTIANRLCTLGVFVEETSADSTKFCYFL